MAKMATRRENNNSGLRQGSNIHNDAQTERLTEDSQLHRGSIKPTKEDQIIWSLRQSGLSGNQIAKLIGVTKHAIYRRLKKFREYADLRTAEKAAHQKDIDLILSMINKGVPPNDILEVVGWEKARFDSWKHRSGTATIDLRAVNARFNVDEAFALLEIGKSTREVAKRYNTNATNIKRQLKRTDKIRYEGNTASRKGGRKPGIILGNSWDVHEAFRLYSEGESTYAISKKLGNISPAMISIGLTKHYGELYLKMAKKRLQKHRKNAGLTWGNLSNKKIRAV